MKYKYDAFISYRHTEPDRFAAENLHRQMEAFRLPGKLSGKAEGRTKIERVFRDKDELPLTNNLEDPIMQALADSEYLIVICSPRLRESLWCRKEIETFIRMHGREKVLAVLIEGEPEESFPEELLFAEESVAAPDGSVSVVRRAVEPLAADIRGRNRHEMLKAMKTEKLRLLAPMFSLNYDDLRQRHRERKMKRILGASLSAAVFFLCFGAFSTAMALRIQSQNRQLEEQKERLEEQKAQLEEQKDQLERQTEEISRQNESLLREQALKLAEDSRRLLEAGDRIGAIRAAVQSLTEYEGIQLPYTAQGEYALTQSLHIYDNGTYIKPRFQMESEGIIRSMALSPDGERLLTYDDTHALILWDIPTGSKIAVREDCSIFLSEGQFVFLDDDRIAYLDTGGSIVIYSWRQERLEGFSQAKGAPREMKVSGNLLALKYSEEVWAFCADTLECKGVYEAPEDHTIYGDIFIDGSGGRVIFCEKPEDTLSGYSEIAFWNPDLGDIRRTQLGDGRIKDVEYAGNTAYVLCDYADEGFYYTAVLTACDMDTGAVRWEKVFADCSGSALFLPRAEGADRLLAATSYDVWIVGMEDGKEYARCSIGSNIAGGAALPAADIYLIYTRSGEYHSILADRLTDYVVERRFQSHSQNVKEFLVCAGGFLVLPYQDNRVTLYTYSENPAYERIENPAEAAADDASIIDAPAFAEEKGLETPALASYVFYSGDGTLLYVCYKNKVLRIYDAGDYGLKAEIDVDSAYINQEIGKDSRGNRFVGSAGYGYMLSPGLELLAVIEQLAAVDSEANRLIVQDSGGAQYGIPIYTVEELLDNAREYVLSCN